MTTTVFDFPTTVRVTVQGGRVTEVIVNDGAPVLGHASFVESDCPKGREGAALDRAVADALDGQDWPAWRFDQW